MESNTKVKDNAGKLVITYIAVLLLMLFFMLSSEADVISIVINVAMLVIIAFVFSFAKKKFKMMQKMTSEFYEATAIIKADSKKYQSYLWDQYKNESAEKLFLEENLLKSYEKYLDEMKRLEYLSGGSYKCAIDNYINKEFLDIIASKNLLNLIPGVMTGLGILGTFIGLTFGLQQFNTGTAAEIADSIVPLMAGIKVAFYTSIVGMICSLMFNWLYKRVFEDTYTALEVFLDTYDLYVTGDVAGNNASSTQNLLSGIPDAISEKIGIKLTEVLEPALERMNITMESFADRVSENQLEGVSKIVDHFVSEMNRSLGNGFRELGELIDQTCEFEKKNVEYIKNILQDIEKVANDTKNINDMSEKTIQGFSSYIEKIEVLQGNINQSFQHLMQQMQGQQQEQREQQEYVKVLVQSEEKIRENLEQFITSISEHLQAVYRLETTISENTQDSMDQIAEKAAEYNDMILKNTEKQIDGMQQMAKNITHNMDMAAEKFDLAAVRLNEQLIDSLDETFEVFDKNLAEIAKHLSRTIEEVETTTGRVPKVVEAAYDGMEKSFEEMKKRIEELSHALSLMKETIVAAQSEEEVEGHERGKIDG